MSKNNDVLYRVEEMGTELVILHDDTISDEELECDGWFKVLQIPKTEE